MFTDSPAEARKKGAAKVLSKQRFAVVHERQALDWMVLAELAAHPAASVYYALSGPLAQIDVMQISARVSGRGSGLVVGGREAALRSIDQWMAPRRAAARARSDARHAAAGLRRRAARRLRSSNVPVGAASRPPIMARMRALPRLTLAVAMLIACGDDTTTGGGGSGASPPAGGAGGAATGGAGGTGAGFEVAAAAARAGRVPRRHDVLGRRVLRVAVRRAGGSARRAAAPRRCARSRPA